MLILEGTLENIGEKQEEESTFFLFFLYQSPQWSRICAANTLKLNM